MNAILGCESFTADLSSATAVTISERPVRAVCDLLPFVRRRAVVEAEGRLARVSNGNRVMRSTFGFNVRSWLVGGYVACAVALVGCGDGARAADSSDAPVKVVGARSFPVTTAAGTGIARAFATGSLDGAPDAVRAIVIVHGLLRNAETYEATGEAAVQAGGAAAAHTLVVAPQFLTGEDVAAHGLSADTLRWNRGTWLDGSPAVAPAPLSAFDALDALVARLADRTRFPALREIVVAGHSAGGQLVQRYAVVRHASPDDALRYVVANPSSYVYFSAERPNAATGACPHFDDWKYGLGDPPPYVRNPAGLESLYVARRVTYLLGLLDTDPNHPVLDKSCAAEREGAYRLIRGRNYVDYLHARHPEGTNQDEVEVPGVGHDGRGMFTSPCGLAVLFGTSLDRCAVTKV
jgi:pimeloyl-ACP methyl ester carboxylesterase